MRIILIKNSTKFRRKKNQCKTKGKARERPPAESMITPVSMGTEFTQSFKTIMSSDSLKKLGLFFDDLKRIRIWEPETAQKTADLKDETKDFVGKVTEFHNTSSDFLITIQNLAREVEKEKIKALGSSNTLKSMAKQRECQQQQYQSLIMEKSAELERLRVQHQSLLKVQIEQQEIIHQIQLY